MAPVAAPPRPRLTAVDAVRGLAIALMVLDHVGILFGWEWLRLSLGRVAMPLFFVLSGALVRRVTVRHVGVGLLGVVVAFLAPWAGSPNVLTVYAVGAVVLVACDRARVPVWLLVAVALAVSANRFEVGSTSYDPAALIGLMALGRIVGLDWTRPLAAVVEPLRLDALGRRPVWWYVGNVLVIQGVMLWVSRLS